MTSHPTVHLVLGTAVLGLLVAAVVYTTRRRRGSTAAAPAPLSHDDIAELLETEVLVDRVVLKPGQLGSESTHPLLSIPATLGRTGRLVLGDLGHVADLIEGDGSSALRAFYAEHAITSILVCMGSAAAQAISRDLDKRGIVYLGLGDCVDQEGYPIIANHLRESVAFIRSHLSADGSEAGGPPPCCLVHCKEGKNRSACLCVAYLMVEERMPLVDAVSHGACHFP